MALFSFRIYIKLYLLLNSVSKFIGHEIRIKINIPFLDEMKFFQNNNFFRLRLVKLIRIRMNNIKMNIIKII